MALSVGSITAKLGFTVDDSAADRYERRIDRVRTKANRDIVQDVKVDVDSTGLNTYEKHVDRAERGTSRFKGGLVALGPLAGAAAATGGAAAVVLGKRWVDTASDISESTSKLETVLGASSKQVEDFAMTSAKSIGQSRSATLEATSTFAAFFKNLGQSNDVSAKSSIAFTKLASDMASFNNTSPEEAIQALSAGLRGEAEPLRRYGVLLDDASLKAQAMKDGLIKTTKDALTPQNRALAAQSLIFAQTKTQQGDFARTSDGLANQQRTLAAQFSDVGAKIGEKLLPFATKAVTALNNLIDSTSKGKGPIAAFAAGFTRVADFIGDAVRVAVDFGRKVRSVFSDTGSDGGKLASNIGRTVREIISTVTNLGRSIGRTFNGVQDDLGDIGRGFLKVFRAVEDVIQPVVRSVLPGISRAIRGVADVVRGVIRTIAALFRGDFAEVFNGLGQIVKGAFNIVRGVLSAAVKGLGTLAIKIGEAILDGLWGIIKAIPGKIGGLLNKGRDLLARAPGAMKKAAAGVGRAIVDGITGAIEGLGKVIADAGKAIGKKLIGAVKSFLGINSPSKAFMEIGRNVIEGLAAGLDGGDIEDIAVKAFGGLPSLAAKLIKNGVIDVSSLTVTGAKKLGDKLGGIGKSALDKLGITSDGEPIGKGIGGGVRSMTGLVPQVHRALAWARSHGWRGVVKSGFRSRREQEILWANRANNPYPVARPGTSNHESGQAIDVTDVDGFRRAMASAPDNARLRWFGPGDAIHFSVTGRRLGGKVGPGSGGARAFIVGEGAKDEWVISQEGNRAANIAYAIDALRTITGREVELHRAGKGRKKAPKPKLSTKENAGLKRAISRKGKGIDKFDDAIADMEREYDILGRKADLDDNDFIIENDDGSTTIDTKAQADRAAELGAARAKRDAIRKKIHAYRKQLTALINSYNAAIAKIKRALDKAKGKSRAKERAGYRATIAAYRGRVKKLTATRSGLVFDEQDSDIDLLELDAEIAEVTGATATAATKEADAPDLSLAGAFIGDEAQTQSDIERDQAIAETTPETTDDEDVRKRGESFFRGVLARLRSSGASNQAITEAARGLKGFLPDTGGDSGGGSGGDGGGTTAPVDPMANAIAILSQVGAFNADRANVFSQFGANFLTNRPLTALDQIAGGRYFGGGTGGTNGGVGFGAGKTINQYITFAGPQPADPHTFTAAANYEAEAQL